MHSLLLGFGFFKIILSVDLASSLFPFTIFCFLTVNTDVQTYKHTAFLNFEWINFNFFKRVLYFASFFVLCEVSKPLCEVPYANFRSLSYFSSSGWFPSTLVSSFSISQWLIMEMQTCTQVHKFELCTSQTDLEVDLLQFKKFYQ